MPKLSDEAIRQAVGDGPWRLEDGAIVRDAQVADFAAALALVNAAGAAAEARDHHPDVLVHGFNRVRFTLSTHSEGGVTEKDLDLARAIDEIMGR